MIWWIIIAVVIIVIISNNNSGDNSNNQTGAGKTNIISCSFEGSGLYSSILNRLEQDVQYITKYAQRYGSEISVVVQVLKINNMYCSVSGSLLADTCFEGINFVGGYNYNGTDQVIFQTRTATGFTTPEDVKRELLLQFNWSDLPVHDAKITLLDYNDYKETPLISYSFKVKK